MKITVLILPNNGINLAKWQTQEEMKFLEKPVVFGRTGSTLWQSWNHILQLHTLQESVTKMKDTYSTLTTVVALALYTNSNFASILFDSRWMYCSSAITTCTERTSCLMNSTSGTDKRSLFTMWFLGMTLSNSRAFSWRPRAIKPLNTLINSREK